MFNKLKLIIIILFLIIILSPSVLANDDLPAIIFVYDDGFQEDFVLSFPIHAKYNIPAVVAVNSDYIGQKYWLKKRNYFFYKLKVGK